MVDAFDAAVGAGMVGTPGDFVDAEALIEGAREFGAELKTVIGKESNGASPERDVAIDQYISRAECGELGLSSGVHIGATAETVGEKENRGVLRSRFTLNFLRLLPFGAPYLTPKPSSANLILHLDE